MALPGVSWLARGINRLQGPAQQPVFWLVVHAVLFLCVFINLSLIYYNGPTPGGTEIQVVLKVLDGQIPYSDFACEYPPLAPLIFLIPGLFFRSLPFYFIGLATEMFLFDILAIFLIAFISRRLNISVARSLTLYTLFIAGVAGPMVVQRYDLVPAVLLLAALEAFIAGKHKTAWAVLALGVAAKLYPVIIAPLFIVWYLLKRQYRRMFEGAAVFLAVILVLVLPWVIIDAQGFWGSISYHLERSLHAESSYGSFMLVGQLLGWTQVEGGFSYGSYNLISPLADNPAKASFPITLGLLVGVYLLYAWKLKKRREDGALSEGHILLQCASLAVVVFLVSSKIFSIQFLIWLCPLLPLLHLRGSNIVAILLLAAGGLTLYIFPFNYTPFARFETCPVIVVAIRNFLLMATRFLLLLPWRLRPVRESG